ncbi:RidA family protein [Pinisolibacter aquiterrae]|uniref:RidA family protein n=1 Tax=Pinisolibacter aquiterrae TaxID=2815579 RepID=UPI001C3DA9E9|nr:RidA family protein [Pinisolibacter aquiterrae]MBV5264643.1 RidA family protein [Pinisolibacter aquiterrae]MCC8233412.1 RidA family protein [Pinisolibacter aquiterrae]
MTTRRLVSTGSPFEKVAGYSRAVAQDDMCWVSGTTGYDYTAMAMPEAVEDQTRNAMNTITHALNEAGFLLQDVVRATYYVTDAAMMDVVFPIVGEYFAEVRPAATMIVCGLVKPEMKIEIEVTAKRKA